MNTSEFWRARQFPVCKMNWKELRWTSFRELHRRFRKRHILFTVFFLACLAFEMRSKLGPWGWEERN